jgi:hypothetical protein
MLQEILRQKFTEQMDRRRFKQDQDRIDLDRQRVEEAQRQSAENAGFLNEQRAAAAAKLQADTEAAAARRRETDALLNDPSVPETTKRWMRGAAVGWNQLTPHDYEDPTAHQSHLEAEAQRKADEAFRQHMRTRDYDVAHPLRPIPVKGLRVAQDDPSLPLGSQRYIAQIAAKHGNDYNAARAELDAYLNDPQTQRDHPRLSPLKALDALKRIASVPGGAGGSGDELDGLISEAFAARAAGGRGAAPGAPARIVNGRLVGAQPAGRSAPQALDAQLAAQAAQVLQSSGYAPTPENIQKFLGNPANRQRLTGGQ